MPTTKYNILQKFTELQLGKSLPHLLFVAFFCLGVLVLLFLAAVVYGVREGLLLTRCLEPRSQF